jgi:cysteine synthase
MKKDSILETIGNTPIVKLNKLYPSPHSVWIKLERSNPGGSIKDRIALSMVEDAENGGILKPGSVIIEPTSGNTGIGLAMVAAVKGYRLILVMPESMTIERRKLMSVYGAEFILTPRELGMKGAIAKAAELIESTPGSWCPSQFENPSNPRIHFETTAKEIAADFPEGLDYLVTGVGTGGHITGVAQFLKSIWPELKVYAVEPDSSPVISGGSAGPHSLQGLGAGFIPVNLDTSILDGVIQVSKEESFEFSRKLAKEEGIFAGISTGSALAAVTKKLSEIQLGSRLLTFNYDTGERYLSVDGLWE